MNEPRDHFDEMTGLLYLEGQLDADHASEVSAHLARCAGCRQLLHALEAEGAWLRSSLVTDDEPIPARLLAATSPRKTHWGWMVAFVFSAAGAYTLWTGFIQPWVTQASQAGFSQGNILSMIFFTGAFWKGWNAMRSTTELLAMATLGLLAVWLLRRRWRRFAAIAFVMGVLILGLALPQVAGAAEIERGDPTYVLPAGQEVNTDLIVMAGRAQIDGDVDGDLIVFSQNITVNGHVRGDIIAFGQELSVNGPVDGNIRAWCQTLVSDSIVAKNVMAWTQSTELEHNSTIDGSLTLGTATGELNGKIGGDLLVLGADLAIDGSMGRNVNIRSDRLSIGPNAEIKGAIKYQGRREADVSPGAKLASPIQYRQLRRGPNYAQVGYYWREVLDWGASFLFGLVLFFVAPGFFADAVNACKKVGPALGFGVLFLIATPIAAIIVCITIVGLGVGVTTLLLYFIAIYAAQVFVGAWLGETVLGPGPAAGAALGRLALGLALLRVVRMLPFIGPLATFVMVIWGLGALVLTAYRNMRPHLVAAVV
jgi:cytoskeletal protein CcmA (bactofilin family)/anti-sigma factor RsiW